MPVKPPMTDTEQIESLLLGQLSPAEAERLSTKLADDSRVAEVGESLQDDTLLSAVRGASTSIDPDAERLTERLVERLKPAPVPVVGSVTMTAILSTDGPVLVDEGDPMPDTLEYFRIERVLGRGGMGTVYLADDTRLGRKVAVKTLKADVARKPGAKERFLREARLAAALEHECLVPIYYVGEAAGIPFIAMPLLKGQGLDEYLAFHGGRLTIPDAVRVAGQIASGLAAAHAAGLIHRDIKPSNVWVDADRGGRVRILDFGLARSAMDDTNLTASGVIVGTPAYMAPEQARGRGVDGRADLFSLGVVMYQMLTGRRPFVGNDTVAILSSLALDIPAAPHTINPDVPPHISELVMKLLEKEPAHRLQSAEAVLKALHPPAVVVVPQAWREAEQTEVIFADMAAPTPRAAKTPAKAKASTQDKPARKFPVAAMVALAVLLVGGAAAAVYQFVFATKDGTLVVEVAEDADVRFKNGKLEVYDETGKKMYTLEPSEKNKALPPGKYRVKVVGADGVKLDTETFELERKGKAFVKVTAAGPKDVAAVDPKKPDPVTPGVPSGSGLAVSTKTIAEAPNPGLDVTKPWTVEAYFTPPADNVVTLVMTSVVSVREAFGLGVNGGEFFVYSRHGTTHGGKFKTGERVHVAGVQTETKRMLFVNGKLVASTDNPLPAAPGAKHVLAFGQQDPPVDMLVEGVRVSQAVRYTKDFTPPGRHETDKQTLALYHCDEGSGDKLTDSSGHDHHGKITNAKWGKAPSVDPDRAAAEWVLSRRDGTFRTVAVLVEGKQVFVSEKGKLPTEPFQLKLADVIGLEVVDDDLARFARLPKLELLNLHASGVTDAGLRRLIDLPALNALNLDRTKVTDAGLPALKQLPSLAKLVLSENAVTDDGLAHLHRLTGLREVYLRATKVTKAGVEKLAVALPNCRIEWDGGVIDPTSGTLLALRKPTWTPGPADNILPGLVSRPALLDGVGRWQIVPTAVPAGAVSFSPDGKRVAVIGDYLRIYDSQTGALVGISRWIDNLWAHGADTWHLDWSADSKWLRVAVRSNNGFTGILVAADGSPSAAPRFDKAAADYGWNPKYPVFAWVPHSTFDRIEIIDPTQAKPIEIAVKIGGKGKAVWSPNGEWLLVVREDKTAQLFSRDGKGWNKLAGEVDPSVKPAWGADSTNIAAMASANEVGFWKTDGTAGKKTGKHEKPVLALHWKPDGQLLAVTEAAGKRLFWKTDGTSEGSADTKDGTPGFEWAKDGKGFFTPNKFWPAVGNPSFTNLVTGRDMVAVASPDQKSVWLAKRGEIVIAEWKDGEAKDIGWKVLQTRDGTPWWSADGKRLAVADQNGIALYDARDPKKVVRLGGGAGVNGLNRAAFSPKGDRFAVANDIGHLLLCEPTGKPIRTLGAPEKAGATLADAIHDLQWHPDGKLLAVTTGAGTVTIFDTETGKAEATTSVQGARAGGSAIFSPANPDHLLIAHPDAAALWRWKVEKEPLQKFDGLGKLVPSPDGKRVLSLQAGGGHHGNDFRSAALLSPDLKDRDTAGTKEYVPLIQHPGASLAWHPDGKHLVVVRNGHEGRSITIRSLDGKVVEEIKPDGIDVTWLEWVSPFAKRNVLVGRIGQGPDVYLFDLTTKKVTSFGKVAGELTVSPDGKHLIALEGSTLTYWNVDTKAVEQKVVLLPNGEFVTLSPAGEVLEKSANADNFYRYVVEDKAGKLLLKTPAEMAPGLPKSVGAAPLDPAWLKAVAAMPAEKQVEAVHAELKKRNPQFDGKGEHNRHVIEGSAVVELELDGKVMDIEPVRALPALKRLVVRKAAAESDHTIPLSDLSPLQGMKLTTLFVFKSQVKDLTPLKGMPIRDLVLAGAKVTDFSPLTGMPLENLELPDTAMADLTVLKGAKLKRLNLLDTQVTDLKPLIGMPLEELQCTNLVGDLTPLQGMKLKSLAVGHPVSDLTPLKGMPLENLQVYGLKLTDLSPIEGMPLKNLEYQLNLERDGKILRSIKSLETINARPAKDVLGGK